MNKKINLMFGLLILSIVFISATTYTDNTNSEFSIDLDGSICSSDNLNWIDYANDPPVFKPTTGKNGNCFEPNGIAGTKCCPKGSECIEKNGLGKCYASSVDFCHQYTTQAECNSYTNHVAENTIETIKGDTGFCNGKIISTYTKNSQDCWDVVKKCLCAWENNNCTAKFTNQSYCGGSWINEETPLCAYTISKWDDRCEIDGFIYASWNYTGGVSCTPAESEIAIPCSEITRLGFFNWINLTAAVLLIAVIYYLIHKKSKKKR